MTSVYTSAGILKTATSTVFADGSYGNITVSGGGTVWTINNLAVTNGMLAGNIDLTTKVTGILPVANGGSGTSTAFTTGSIVFAGASGVYSENNAKLFWDNSNNWLGIGSTSPTVPLDVVGAIKGTTTATLGAAGGTAGKLTLTGSTSGTVSLQAAAAAGAVTYTLPSADGTSGQVLSTNGSGTLSWASGAAVAGSSGQLQYNNSSAFGGAAALTYATSADILTITAPAATDKPLIVKGAASQSANLMEFRNSSGTALTTIDSAGSLSGVAATFSSTLGVTGAITGSSTATATAFIPSGSSVPTNGMYLPAANRVSLATNSTERMTIDSSGNVGIGTSTAAGQLNVRRDTSSSSISSTTSLVDLANRDVTTNNVIPIRFNTLDSGSTYRNAAWIAAQTTARAAAAVTADIIFGTTNNTTSASEVMRVSGAGYLGIGSTSPTVPLHVELTGGRAAYFKGVTGQSRVDIDAHTAGQNSQLNFLSASATIFSSGIDGSDSNTWKLCNSSSIGTNTRFQVTTSGEATFFNSTFAPNLMTRGAAKMLAIGATL